MATAVTTEVRERFIIRAKDGQYVQNVSIRYNDLQQRHKVFGKFNPILSNERCEAYRFVCLADANLYAKRQLNPEFGPYKVEVDFDAPL